MKSNSPTITKKIDFPAGLFGCWEMESCKFISHVWFPAKLQQMLQPISINQTAPRVIFA